MALDHDNNQAFTKNNNRVVRGIFSSSWSCESNYENNRNNSTMAKEHEEILPPTTQNIIISSFEDGLDYILSHFEEPIWPRTIFTHTIGKQVLVFNKEEALAKYRHANILDCRINAYPDYIEYGGINRQSPNFLFLDLDKSTFKTERAFNLTLKKTLRNLNDTLNAKSPTILWSGNGYHIYQPVSAFPLEQEELFSSKSNEPSKEFLQFAELHLTDYKSDPSHHPSVKSCLIRIPGSYNFKCVQRNNGIADSSTEVKIIQKWDGIRPKFNPLLYDFNIWLADKKLKEINEIARLKRKRDYNSITAKPGEIKWIEDLLQTPIDDHRKNAVALILAPYLVNIKKLSYANAFSRINEWLYKCNSVRILDSNFNYRIKYALDNVIKNGYLPMKLDTLRVKKKSLYDILKPTGKKN